MLVEFQRTVLGTGLLILQETAFHNGFRQPQSRSLALSYTVEDPVY